ncbi:MAG: peptide chain release factor N(5)-glutamine methyltransferase [Candidatus Cloacimonetes bacterium]|nr:peptide chain release factor N(5)-glutamine methyltransferase [Candidatus Cloacimonadota bacterium]
MILKDILTESIQLLGNHSIDNPRLNAELLISNIVQMSRANLYLQQNLTINSDQINKIRNFISRRISGEPLQYIVGEIEFAGCRILVDKTVLIPRPETELLVDLICKDMQSPNRILEIGTGSGAIAIALAKKFSHSRIEAVDISPEALQTARKNALLNHVLVQFYYSDLFSEVTGRFDLIVSNPPYISKREYDQLPAEIKCFEPKKALLAEDQGLFFYRQILKKAKDYLTDSGIIFFENGFQQGNRIKEIAQKYNFGHVEIMNDLNGIDRYLKIGWENG